MSACNATQRVIQINTLYKEMNSYSKVARFLGISKQRVHQAVSGYKNTGRRGRSKKYEDLNSFCMLCLKNSMKNLHHIDGDNKNDSIDNLLPVCTKCHGEIHKALGSIKKMEKGHIYKKLCLCCGVDGEQRYYGYCGPCFDRLGKEVKPL